MRVADPIANPSRGSESGYRVLRTDGRTNEERDEKLISLLSNRHACARTPELLRRLAAEAGFDIDVLPEEKP